MKFDTLRSIGHNVADSLASGVGVLVGIWETDIFGEASRSPEKFITVDFLAGTSSGAAPSENLRRAIASYKDGLARLCEKHGASRSHFRELSARYSGTGFGRRYVVTIEDAQGRRAEDVYVGSPGRRPRLLDISGRVRTLRQPTARSRRDPDRTS